MLGRIILIIRSTSGTFAGLQIEQTRRPTTHDTFGSNSIIVRLIGGAIAKCVWPVSCELNLFPVVGFVLGEVSALHKEVCCVWGCYVG